MWKFKTKSAFTLVEVMCSIGIFSLLFITALTIELNAIKIRKYNKDICETSILIEALKNNIIGNTTYNELKSLKESNKIYINKEFLKLSKLKVYKVYDATSVSIDNSEEYVKLNLAEGTVIEVEIELHTKNNNIEEVTKCKVYKGNYQ